MNILAVGDIVGSSGVKELQKRLQKVKTEYNVDFVIVNGENAAEGMGAKAEGIAGSRRRRGSAGGLRHCV